MTRNTDDRIIIGKIGAPFGIKGWVKIHSFTDEKTTIFEYSPWYIENTNGWQAIKVTDGQEHGKGLIVKLDGYNTPEQVKVLTGKAIEIKRSQLPPLKKDEYYWSDLKDLTVINQDNQVLGTISYLMETGSNDVMVVKKDDKEHAIPYLRGSVVVSIDLANRVMHVNWELI